MIHFASNFFIQQITDTLYGHWKYEPENKRLHISDIGFWKHEAMYSFAFEII